MEQILDTTPINIATNEIVINNTTIDTNIDENNNIVDVNVENIQDFQNIGDIEDDTPDLEEMIFEPIHTILEYKNKEGKVRRIKIYNVDDEKNNELMKIIMKYSTIGEDGQIDTNIPPMVVINSVMKILTNIKFPEDEEKINKIIENPKDYLKRTLLIVTDILKTTLEINFKSLEITKDTLEKMGLTDEKLIQMVEKQKEVKSLEFELEKEKQETSKIKANENEDLVRELLQKVNKLEVEKLGVLAENEKLKEVKPKRKYNKKKKVEQIESKEENKDSEE